MDIRALELDPETIARLVEQSAAIVLPHLTRPSSRPIAIPTTLAEASARVGGALPLDAADPSRVLEEVASLIAPYGVHNGHPRFFGYVGTSAVPLAVLADGIAAALNLNVVTSRSRPTAVAVELAVLSWLARLLGLPADARGLLTSGGTQANMLCLAALRSAAFPEVRREGMRSLGRQALLYAAPDAHHCHRKIVELLGFGSRSLRIVPADARRRLDLGELRAAIAADRTSGALPFAVIASAGTALTGAVDPVADLADLCDEEDLWLHVDACHGGFARLGAAALGAETARHLDALGRADSVAADAHKFLFMPLEAGVAFVRHPAHLRAAFGATADYLAGGEHDFFQDGLATSRAFRALKIWVAMRAHGARAFEAAVEGCLRLAQALSAKIAAAPELELAAAAPELSTLCFRYMPQGRAPEDIDQLNAALVRELQQGGSTFVSDTTLDGRPVIRACIMNFRTRPADLDIFLDEVREIGRRLS